MMGSSFILFLIHEVVSDSNHQINESNLSRDFVSTFTSQVSEKLWLMQLFLQ